MPGGKRGVPRTAPTAPAHPGSRGRLGRVGGATRGSVRGPLGFESQWAPSVLPAELYCFLRVSWAWEAEAGFLRSEGPCFVTFRSQARGLSLRAGLDGGRLRALRSSRFPEHEGPFLFPEEESTGKSQFLWPLDMREEPPKPSDLTFWHVQDHPTQPRPPPPMSSGVAGAAARFLVPGLLHEAITSRKHSRLCLWL